MDLARLAHSGWAWVASAGGISSMLAFWQRQRLSRYFSPAKNLVICESEKAYLAQALLDILEVRERVGPSSPLTELARRYATSSGRPTNFARNSWTGSGATDQATGEAWKRRSSDRGTNRRSTED
jgi:hypothetical protein